jgi:uracil-DNA glycosylase family 4
MFVGEAPGEHEEARGIPFIGRAGHLLLDLLEEAEFNVPYSITNAVCCRPTKRVHRNLVNRPPKVSEWRTCSHRYLRRSIETQSPRLIICLGTVALKAVLNDSSHSLKKARRKIFYRETPVRGKGRGTDTTRKTRDIPVVCTYHPAALLRDPTKRSVVIEDLRQFLRILSGEELDEDPTDRIYKWQGDDEDLPSNLSAGHALSLDLETTGLQPHAPGFRVLACGVSQAPLHAHAFHLGDNLGSSRFRDVRGKLFCTMVAFDLLDENYPNKTLQHLALLFTTMGEYAPGKDARTAKGYAGESDDDMFADVCGDADAAYRLYLLFENRLRKEKLLRAFGLYMRTLRTLVDVQYNGAFIDTDALDIATIQYEKRYKRIIKWLTRTHPTLRNPRSSQQASKLLYKTFKIRPTRWTGSGVASTDEKALQSVLRRAKNPLHKKTVRGITEMRRLNTMLTRYILPLRDEHIMPDGMAHPKYNLTGAVSRLSSQEPNFQNIPEEFRRVFSSRWGYKGVIVQVDFSQAELRVLAHYSQERRLLEAFHKNKDIHVETASEIFHAPSEQITKAQRALAKKLNFLIVYQGGAKLLAEEAGIPLSEAYDYHDLYLQRMPAVTRWVNKIKRQIMRTGEVRCLFGRKRRLRVDDPSSEEGQRMLRQGVNFPIQHTAAGITLLCMNDIHEYLIRGMDSVIIGTVHDSIVLDCPPDEVDEVMMLCEEICDRPDTKRYGFELTVPMKVDITFGPNWRDQKEI